MLDDNTWQLIQSVGVAGLGLIVLSGGVALFRRRRAFEARAVFVLGKVLQVNRQTYRDEGGKTKQRYSAVIGFRTQEGKSVSFEADRVGTSLRSVGETVQVLYDPADPEQARTHSPIVTWVIPAFIALLGLGLFGLGVALVFWR